jgi:hypothetical protein
VTREIEQRRADRPRCADNEDRLAGRQTAIARQHLEGCKVGERYTDGLCRIDTIWNRHKKTRGTNGVLRVTTHHTEIGNDLPFARSDNVSPSLLDNTYKLVARCKWQRSFEIRVTATTDEAVREAGPGCQNLDARLGGARIRDDRLLRQFQDLGATEPGNANALP